MFRSRDCIRQPSGRVDLAGNDVGKRMPTLHAGIPTHHHCGRLVHPFVHQHGTSGDHYDDRARIGFGDGVDEFHVFRIQMQACAIAAFRIATERAYAFLHVGLAGLLRRALFRSHRFRQQRQHIRGDHALEVFALIIRRVADDHDRGIGMTCATRSLCGVASFRVIHRIVAECRAQPLQWRHRVRSSYVRRALITGVRRIRQPAGYRNT